MKNIYFLFLFTAFAKNLNAQNLITLQHGSTATFYTDLQASITAAQDGDYIYIPGGTWGILNNAIDINKRLNVYGAGALTDSTIATGVSLIISTFRFNSGSSNSFVSGCKFSSSIIIGYDTCANYVDNISVGNNYCTSSLNCYSKSRNTYLKNNVFSGLLFSNSQNFSILNNIILGSVQITNNNSNTQQSYGSLINNYINSLSGNVGGGTSAPSNILIKNNYIFSSGNGNITNSNFFNNFSNINLLGSYSTTNTYINNQIATLSSIFINVPSASTYSPVNNYHIITTSPAHNAGDDGTDIGIYGGTNPWKEGLVPANPHIRFSNINSQTGTGGNLPVNIKVGAQDH